MFLSVRALTSVQDWGEEEEDEWGKRAVVEKEKDIMRMAAKEIMKIDTYKC